MSITRSDLCTAAFVQTFRPDTAKRLVTDGWLDNTVNTVQDLSSLLVVRLSFPETVQNGGSTRPITAEHTNPTGIHGSITTLLFADLQLGLLTNFWNVVRMAHTSFVLARYVQMFQMTHINDKLYSQRSLQTVILLSYIYFYYIISILYIYFFILYYIFLYYLYIFDIYYIWQSTVERNNILKHNEEIMFHLKFNLKLIKLVFSLYFE